MKFIGYQYVYKCWSHVCQVAKVEPKRITPGWCGSEHRLYTEPVQALTHQCLSSYNSGQISHINIILIV